MKKFLPFLIALFAGIAQGYSLAPANEWLQLAALAVLFFIFAGLRTAKAGFLAGLFFGIGWFVTSLAWLYVSVHDYGYQPPVFAAFVVFIFSCYLALYPAAVGALCAWSMKRGSSAGLMLLAIAPAAWGLTEWLRGVLFSGFPWSAVSYAHVDGSLSAFAPICGADGINFLAAFISGCAALLLLERKNLKGIAVSCAGLLVVFSLAFALTDIRWSEPYKTLSVRLVQGGIAQDEKFSPMGSLTSFERYVRLMDEKGIQVTWTDKRKHITFADAEGHKVRDSNFEKTLKIPCSKDSLEAHFAENAKNVQALKKLQEESAKTEKASFWKSLTQSITQTVASWRKQHQEAATQEALQIAAQTSIMTGKEVTSHEIPTTVRTSGRISPSTPDCGTPEQGRKTNSRDSGTGEREATASSGERRTESRPGAHQRKHYLSSTRNNAKKSRDQGMER